MYMQPISLKTNLLTKFAVIWAKRRQKAGLSAREAPKSQQRRKRKGGKERRKGKSEEKERRRRKKQAMVALLVFIIATLEIVFGRKQEHNTINWRDTTHFDSEDDYCTGCRNVTHCQQQQSYSGLPSPRRSNPTYFWNGSWVKTFHKKKTVGRKRSIWW